MNGEKEQDQQKRREGSQTSMGDGHVNVNHGSYASEKAGWGDGERFYCNAYSHGMAWFKVKIMVNQFDQSIVQSVQTETVLYCTYKRGDLARAVYPLLSFAPLTLTEGERERETGCCSINSSSSRGGVSIESYGARGRVQHSIAKVARQQQFTREKGN
jgi:hypothetical protein